MNYNWHNIEVYDDVVIESGDSEKEAAEKLYNFIKSNTTVMEASCTIVTTRKGKRMFKRLKRYVDGYPVFYKHPIKWFKNYQKIKYSLKAKRRAKRYNVCKFCEYCLCSSFGGNAVCMEKNIYIYFYDKGCDLYKTDKMFESYLKELRR